MVVLCDKDIYPTQNLSMSTFSKSGQWLENIVNKGGRLIRSTLGETKKLAYYEEDREEV